MTNQVLVGVVCGLSTGLVVVVLYLLCQYFKRRTDGRHKKQQLGDPKLRSRTIVQNEIPNFHIPSTIPITVQEPLKSYEGPSESSDGVISLSPGIKHRVDVWQTPRGSVQLEHILTPTPNTPHAGSRPHSPLPSSSSSYPLPIKTTPTTKRAEKIKKRKKQCSVPLGKLEFSLYYDQGYKLLQIYVVKGIQIYIPGTDSPTDIVLRVTVIVDGEEIWEQKTRTAHKTANPQFNEKLEFHALAVRTLRAATLKFQVLDDSTKSAVGECIYKLADLPFNMFTTQITKLSDAEIDVEPAEKVADGHSPKLGELLISMSHNPTDKKLTVRVESARGLPVMYKGTTDPFVKVEVLFVGRRLHSRSTKVLHRTTDPNFNDIFIFDISDEKLPQITITFKVKHRGRVRDSNIGKIDLGYNAEHEIEYRHWEQVLDKPHMEIEKWHEIRTGTN